MSNRLSLPFFRANKAKTGAAGIFDFDPAGKRGPALFIKMAQQDGDGDRSFDLKGGLVMSASQTDIGDMIAVIEGRQGGLGQKNEKGYWSGSVHKFNNQTSTLGFQYNEDKNTYTLSIYKNDRRIAISLSQGDASRLKILLQTAAMANMVDTYNPAEQDGPAQSSAPKSANKQSPPARGGGQTARGRAQPQQEAEDEIPV